MSDLFLYSPSELERLKDIQEIRGSLTIELFDRQNFSYLPNLKIIGSDPSQVLSFTCNGTEGRMKFTVLIEETDLVSLDLSSLERIENGGIQLINNPSLCYIGNLSNYITDSSVDICISDNNYRRPEEECGKKIYHNYLIDIIYTDIVIVLHFNDNCFFL